MLTAIFGRTASLLDKNAVLGLFLPCLGFAAAIGALVVSAHGWAETRALVTALRSSDWWLVGVAGTAGFALFVVVFETQVGHVVRLWEGYGWPRRLRGYCAGRQARRRQAMQQEGRLSDSTRLSREYPCHESQLLPTRLGNVLRSALSYSAERYGFEGALFWARLYLMLPDTTRSIVDESRRAISHYITVATLSLLTCVIALGMGTARLLTVETWLPTVCGAALLAFIAYRSSVAAALTFSDLIRSVVDLQRRRLLAEYHLALPSSPAEERRLWHVLSKHLLGHTSDQDSESVIRYAIRTDLT